MRFLLTSSILCACMLVHAQSVTDALRYSTYDVLGTARSVAVGGSMSAIGADFSMLSSNPAGVAAYRSSEFMITPSLFINSNDAELLESETGQMSESVTKFLLGNLGFVFGSRPRNP